MIVVDTSILSDHLRGDSRGHTILSSVFQRAPRKAAQMQSVPPWHYSPDSLPLANPPMALVTDATVSLLRHFSYRHPAACIRALGPSLSNRYR